MPLHYLAKFHTHSVKIEKDFFVTMEFLGLLARRELRFALASRWVNINIYYNLFVCLFIYILVLDEAEEQHRIENDPMEVDSAYSLIQGNWKLRLVMGLCKWHWLAILLEFVDVPRDLSYNAMNELVNAIKRIYKDKKWTPWFHRARILLYIYYFHVLTKA